MSYKSEKKRCLKDGVLFEDPDFPASSAVLFYDKTVDAEWKRPKEFCKNPEFIIGGATKNDLSQGAIGNCWFLAAAATVSTNRKLFKKVVPQNQSFEEDYCGIFRFNFWRFGEWVEVIIDDRLPTHKGKLLFCRNNETPNEFWSPLLEKAYAKVCGSYQALVGGVCQDGLVDFTGGVGEEIKLKDIPESQYKKQFNRLRKMSKRNSFLCAAIFGDGGSTGEVTLDNGLVAGHAYSITDVIKLDLTNGEKVQLVRLRNPWGKREWKGDWSDSSDKWSLVADNMKEKLNLVNLDNGEFFMPFEEMMKNFSAIQICHLTDTTGKGGQEDKLEWNTACYHGEWIKGVTAGGHYTGQDVYWINPQYFVELTEPDDDEAEGKCTLIVSLMQKHRRRMKTELKTTNTELPIGMDLFKFKGKKPKELDGFQAKERALKIEKQEMTFKTSREMSHTFELEPGLYCVIPNTFYAESEGQFMVRFVTEKPMNSSEAGTENEVKSTSLEAESSPEPEEKGTKFERLFNENAGEDGVIDARELRKILNTGLMHEKDEDFSKELCRELIQSVAGERRGLLEKSECRQVWRKVKKLQATFNKFDKDNSGTLDAVELRQAFRALGYKLGKKAQANIVKKYSDKKNHLSLDDFVLVVTKMENSTELFNKLSRSGRGPEDIEDEESEVSCSVELSSDQFVEMNL